MKSPRRITFSISLALFAAVLPRAAGATAPARPTPSEAVVKPGTKITFNDTYCTMNFVFKGSDGHKYVGTAGHCPQADVEGIEVYKRGEIPAGDASGSPIGEFAFGAFSEEEHYDFALVRLDRGVQPDPQVEHYGGPTALNDDLTTETELVNMYGQGMAMSDVSPARQLLAPHGFDDRETLFVTGPATPGDSGAPATSEDDEAIGIVVAGGLYLRIPEGGPPYPGIVKIARLGHNVALAEQELGIRLKLMEAPPL